MNNRTLPRDVRILWQVVPLACVVLLAGCQSYQPLPLDLAEHQANVATRLAEDESLHAFAERLTAADTDTDDPFDTSDGISSAEAEVIALFYNPDLRLARLRAGAALANVENAGLWEDPVFGFDGDELLSPRGPFEYGLTASLTIPISGRLGVEEDKADAAYRSELRRVVDAEWSMRSKVREAWASWSVSTERLHLIDEVAKAIDRIIKVSDRLEDAGELTRVETRLLRAQRLTLRVQRLAISADAELARLDLMRLMGLLPSSEVTLVPALPMIDLPEPSDVAARLIRSNTSLAALRADYRVAEESLRLEIRKQYPDIEIGAGLGSEEGDDRLLLGVSLPIPILNANRGGIAKARANRELALAAAETEYERLAFQLAATFARLEATEQQRQLLTKEMVPMLDEQAAEIDRLAELGEVDTLILLETVTRRFEAKNQILDLHLTSLRDRIEVVRLLGPEDTPEPAPISGNNDKEMTMDGRDDVAEGFSQ
jgi:outer membrane protein TolC